MLTWSLFLGLALLLAAPAFPGGGQHGWIRATLLAARTLSVAGILGPALGDLRLWMIGVAGYGIGLPAACMMMARLFARSRPPFG